MRALWHLTYLCPIPLLSMVAVVKSSSPYSQYEFLVLEGTSEFCYQGVILVYFEMSGSFLKEWQKVPAFFLLNLWFSQDRKEVMQGTLLKNTERQLTSCCPQGQKIQLGKTVAMPTAWEETLQRELLWEIIVFKIPQYNKKSKKP